MSENAVYLLLLGLAFTTMPAPKNAVPVVQPAPEPLPVLYTPISSATNQRSSASCRPFKTLTEMNGRVEVVHGTACRQADGTWKAF